jgi:hypothetical protein
VKDFTLKRKQTREMRKKATVVCFDKLQSKSHSHERMVILHPEAAKREKNAYTVYLICPMWTAAK